MSAEWPGDRPTTRAGGRAIRVLNVNDREIARYVNEQTLRQGGFHVVSASTGQEALAAMDGDIDVVLLDVQLPDVDGFEVCRRIKANPATASVIVLLSSATFVTAKSKITGLDSGADGYRVQPYESDELFATLRSLLRLRAAERKAKALADDLRAAMDVRDQFLAMLGHELRNPLATITTALQLMEEEKDPAAVERYREVLSRQTGSLTRIVDDLLDVGRLTRGKVSLASDIIDLRAIAEQCIQAQVAILRQARHRLTTRLPATPVLVRGDAVRLEQIASNLLTNAIKYTPPGGNLSVGVGAQGDRAVLEVADDGIGLDAAMCERAFDVFVQGTQGIERSRGGLGLGLAVVRQLVELHGGTVRAFSDGEGQGSRFVVELPRIEVGVPAPPPAAAVVPPVAGPPVRIVVIEDNPEVRETLCDALGRYHPVEAAADGVEGVELVKASRPDVVLVDIGLPRLDGYEVAREIRAAEDGARPHLIALTGYGQPEDGARAAAAGFDLHLVKPVSLTRLRQVLASLPQRPA